MGKERKILITNDDGIGAEGMQRLAQIATKFGEVWIVAPAMQCSAMSHRITIRQKMRLEQVDYPVAVAGAYRLDGMPADCVKVGIHHIMSEKPDYVFSGINHGWNIGFDTHYSGTVCAAVEGIMNQVPSIAFSAAMDQWDVVDAYLEQVIRECFDQPVMSDAIWNVNFPNCLSEHCAGIRSGVKVAPMQLFADSITEYQEEDGSMSVAEEGAMQEGIHAPAGSDIEAVFQDYISIAKIVCPSLHFGNRG